MESIKLSIVVQSYLSDLLVEYSIDPRMDGRHIRFVKLLTFYNPDLRIYVTTDYLDEMWDVVMGGDISVGVSFKNFQIEKYSK